MTRQTFTKTLHSLIGFFSFSLGTMVACSDISHNILIGFSIYAIGAAIILVSNALKTDKTTLKNTFKKVSKGAIVLAVSALLITVGILSMINIHWIIGVAFIFAGIISMLFIGPAVNGFVDE